MQESVTVDAPCLAKHVWLSRAREHHDRVDVWVGDRLSRRARAEKHPVDDFLFDYYPYSPARLRRWHPGPGVRLHGRADEPLEVSGFVHTRGTTFFDHTTLPENIGKRLELEVPNTLRLLKNIHVRSSSFGCFGLHEWAMVLGLDAEQVRHASWPLRVTPEVIRQTIDDAGLRCTHFDAFRFFTPEAIPLNPTRLTRQNQPDTDQPGCLHATMDLYKHAMRVQPLVPMDLVADVFALARDIRTLDMQGAPYDLAGIGVTPIPLETAQGRMEFSRLQRQHTHRGSALRERLINALTPWAAGPAAAAEGRPRNKPQVL